MNDSIDKDLLDQLNGRAADLPPFVGGEAPAPAPVRDAELKMPEPAAPMGLQALDAAHSTVVGGAGYRVKVRGDYYAEGPNGKGKVKKAYEAEFNVPRLEGCLSLIKNRLLKPTLRKLHPDFVTDRTLEIVSYQPIGGAPKSDSLAYMNRPDLENVARLKRVPVDLASFPKNDAGTAALRESLIDYVQNPDPIRLDEKGRNTVRPGDPGTFVARENERRAKRIEDAELAVLNPGLEVAS
jgi:hypothetical protein